MGLIFETFCPNLYPICGRFSTLSQFVGNFVPHGSSTFQLWVWRVKQWRPRRSLTSYSWSPPPHQTCFYIKSSNFSSFLAFCFSLFCFLRKGQFHVVAAIIYLFCAGIFISLHNGSSSFRLSWPINAKRQNEKYNISALFLAVQDSSIGDIVTH